MINKTKFQLIGILIIGLFSVCNNNNNPVSIVEKTSEGIVYSAEGIKAVYSLSDTIKINFKVQNTTSLEKVYRFSTGCQLGFKLLTSNVVVKSYPEICTQVITSLHVGPEETKELQAGSLLKDENGNSLMPGNYTIRIFLLNNNSPVLESNFIIK